MKIESRKVSQSPKNFDVQFNSVQIEGTFCQISPSLVKVDSTLKGFMTVQFARCGEDDTINLEEDYNFFISDGIFENESSKSEDLVIEVDNHIIDFNEIIESELSSIYSDYHICRKCTDSELVDKEY